MLVYIGAVMVLFLFGIMLTRASMGDDEGVGDEKRAMAAVVGILLFAVMAFALVDSFDDIEIVTDGPQSATTVSRLDLQPVHRAVRGGVGPPARRPHRRHRRGPEGLRRIAHAAQQFLLLAAVLFCIGVYGVLARKNGVLVLMSIELILNAVNINLVAFGTFTDDVGGAVFALFAIAVAAAEVGIGLAIVLLMYRNRRSIDLSEADLLKG